MAQDTHITVSPLTGPHSLACPACWHAVLIAHPDRVEAPDSAWLADGGTVPGVRAGLTAGQRRVVADYSVLAGTCHACHADYCAVVLDVADGMTFEDLVGGRVDRGRERCARCTAPGREPWLLVQYSVVGREVRQHVFGPWRRVSGDGEWAQARRLLLDLWDGLAAARMPAGRGR